MIEGGDGIGMISRHNKTTRSVRHVGTPIRIFEAVDDRDEADFVASQVPFSVVDDDGDRPQ